MKYLVFFGISNQSAGGINDLFGSFNKIEECYELLNQKKEEYKDSKISIWGQIYDLEKLEKIYHFNDEYIGIN